MKRGPTQKELDSDTLDELFSCAYWNDTFEPHALVASLVEISDEFKAEIRAQLHKDKQWKDIIILIQKQQNLDRQAQEHNHSDPAFAKVIRFRYEDELLFFVDPSDDRWRLCIPQAMEKQIFNLIYDQHFHFGMHKSYQRIIASMFIRKLRKKLRDYNNHCPTCQTHQTKRHKPYGNLHPIDTPPWAYHTITLDFVVALPPCEIDLRTFDAMLTVTCKFTKKMALIPGHEDYTAAQWGKCLLTALLERAWGMPSALISDRDRKFVSELWKGMFNQLGASLYLTMAYHPSADGQSERTNQTVEIALCMFVADNPDKGWAEALPAL